ncbi:MAG: thiamine pyrophosphate-dependent enzyme, partial [Anaerolineaceae bacterium]|nr:thiamine pyrophosphate-dependent enzyme [Anaerolineaceae bacterium]
WKLPVVYVIENNQYALSMPNDLVSAVTDLSSRGCGYGIPGEKADGNNVIAVYEAASKAVEKARNGGGPTLLECITYRIRGHARFEPADYRNKAEVEQWAKFDPIKRFKDAALSGGSFSAQELVSIEKKVEEEITAAVAFASAGEEVGAEDYLQYIFEQPSESAGSR